MIALLELDPALLGLLQRGLAAAQLLVEELQALAGLAPVAGEILLLTNRSIRPWTVPAAVRGILARWRSRRCSTVALISKPPSGWAVTVIAGAAPSTTAARSRSLATRLLRSVRRTTRARFSFEVRVCFSRSSWSLRSSGVHADLVGQDRLRLDEQAAPSTS